MSDEKKNMRTRKLDWNKLDELTDPELATLVESTIFVLKRSDESASATAAEMPASAMTKALEKSLSERGMDASVADSIVKQAKLSRPIAIILLQEIAAVPALAHEIEGVWRERNGMLVVGAGVILAAALMILVLKLKKIKVNKESGVEVDLDKLSTGALGSVFKFLGV
ncbi:MAG: hypothetical protein Q7R66_18425 [Undibacterium sp.]|uniref:hypothetical protein n=1 Tax=Undibacterium sp. TaxID=1914977 RepID=UPI0027250E16|nr:hypothetical protein [Undibacterium sp.]MDO8654152.1 hypothetical protein [Undibacterium sp.]